MRLSCPNCSAEYEIAEALMPESGRNLQCSRCSHAWTHYPSLLLLTPAQETDAGEAIGKAPKSAAAKEVKKPAPKKAVSKKVAPKKTTPKKVKKISAKLLETELNAELERDLSSAQIVEILRDEAHYAKALRQSPAVKTAKPAKEPKTKKPATTKTTPAEFITPKTVTESPFDALAEAVANSPGLQEPKPQKTPRAFMMGFQSGLFLVLILAALYNFAAPIKTLLPAAAPLLDAYTELTETTLTQGWEFYLQSVKPTLDTFINTLNDL